MAGQQSRINSLKPKTTPQNKSINGAEFERDTKSN
jgi:hypothetical protein